MAIFEQATLEAVKLLNSKEVEHPAAAWRIALFKLGASESMIDKSCPLHTFLDLCNQGYIKNIPKATSKLSENGKMALKAIDILISNNWVIDNKQVFWAEHFHKSYENQLDIIFALKNNDLLII